MKKSILPLRIYGMFLLAVAGTVISSTATAQYTGYTTNPFGLSDVGVYSSPALVDINNDGDLDYFLGEQDPNLNYYQNTGTVTSPAFAAAVSNPFGISGVPYQSAPFFVDIDNDSDFDLFIGDEEGDFYFYQNTGTVSAPAFAAAVTNPYGLASVSDGEASPFFVDIDDDNDYDLFVGCYSDVVYFQNTGTAVAPAFAAAVTYPFGTVDPGGAGFVSLPDFDSDGDFDMFIGGDLMETYYLENTGTASSPAFGAPVSDPFGLVPVLATSDAAPIFADINNDGHLDCFMGEFLGKTYYWGGTGSVGLTHNETPVVISMFPNPVVNTLTVSADVVIEKVEIYSVTGSLMISLQNLNDFSCMIDVLTLAHGTYLVKISTADGTFSKKVIK